MNHFIIYHSFSKKRMSAYRPAVITVAERKARIYVEEFLEVSASM